MDQIFEQFNQILPINQKEIEELTPFLIKKSLAKDKFLVVEDSVCKYLAFIISGSFRHYHINANGSSTNIWLSSNLEFISNYHSLRTGVPSNISIQAIDDSEVILIHRDDFNSLFEDSLYWNKLGRLMVESISYIIIDRLESIIYKTPEERYLDLITRMPEFLEKYSLTDIASFIGVTIQSLSRIRARV